MLTMVEKKRAYESIVIQLTDLIEKGMLKRGHQLPPERGLSEAFKVSRTTVREAIRTLESMRFIESRQGDGTYVITSSEEIMVQPLAAVLFQRNDDIKDVFQLRMIIEPYAALLAAQRATHEEIVELERGLDDQKLDISMGRNILVTDSAFHYEIARLAKIRILQHLVIALVSLLAEARAQYLRNDLRAKETLRGHQKILTAIKHGDCTAAWDAMKRHLCNEDDTLFKMNERQRRHDRSDIQPRCTTV